MGNTSENTKENKKRVKEIKALMEVLKTEITDSETCVKEVKYTLSNEDLQKTFNQIIKGTIPNVQIKGFRKGKAPVNMVKKQYTTYAEEEVIGRLEQISYMKANQEFDVLAYENIEMPNVTIDSKDDFTFTKRYHILSEFDIPKYKGIKVKKDKSAISKKDIESALKQYRDAYADYEDIKEKAVAGDILKVKYTSDFKVAEDASVSLKRQVEADENWLFLQEPELIPGANKALIGAEIDKEYEVKAEYAADYRIEELAGKTVNYKIKVIGVQRKTAIADNAALAKKMGVADATELEDRVKSNLEIQAISKTEAKYRSDVYGKVVDSVKDFEFSKKIIEMRAHRILQAIMHEKIKTEADVKPFQAKQEEYKKESETQAKEELKRQYIARAIAKKENIKVEDDDLDQEITYLAKQSKMKEKDLRANLEKSGMIDDFAADILTQKVINFIVINAEEEK